MSFISVDFVLVHCFREFLLSIGLQLGAEHPGSFLISLLGGASVLTSRQGAVEQWRPSPMEDKGILGFGEEGRFEGTNSA